jgi:hypothetical protein
VAMDEATDEFASYFNGLPPKVLITTSKYVAKVISYHIIDYNNNNNNNNVIAVELFSLLIRLPRNYYQYSLIQNLFDVKQNMKLNKWLNFVRIATTLIL